MLELLEKEKKKKKKTPSAGIEDYRKEKGK